MSGAEPDFPHDLIIDAADEVRIRQDFVLVALGRRPADLTIRVGRLLDVHTGRWLDDQEIVIRRRRIAWVSPAGAYAGTVHRRVDRAGLAAVAGFGEVHKHIESSHLTPEYEAALVLPRGNSWTCEASHEMSNVIGMDNLAFWLRARRLGSPLKIFPLPGSAMPPTGYESGGGWFGHDEQAAFMRAELMVAGLDEVMDWPAVWNPQTPSYDRLWGMIGATFAQRGVVEGHGAGLRATGDQRVHRRRAGLRPRGLDRAGSARQAGRRAVRRAAAARVARGDPGPARRRAGRCLAGGPHHGRPVREPDVRVVGSSDAAMARAVDQIADQRGGWALVRDGVVVS